jgi:hypothetical protein
MINPMMAEGQKTRLTPTSMRVLNSTSRICDEAFLGLNGLVRTGQNIVGGSMKGLLLLLILWAGTSLAQSPFDGTWMIDSESMTVPEKPVVYLVAKGMIRGVGCTGNVEIKADGNDHDIPRGSYWDAASARIVDGSTVEIICKKVRETNVYGDRHGFPRRKYADPNGKRHDRSGSRHYRDS